MSYDIDRTIVANSHNAWMSMVDFIVLKANLAEDDLPEKCFFDYVKNMFDITARIEFKDRLMWSGSGSGSTYEVLRDKILPKVHGWLELVFIWNGGDSITGIAVDDGRVIECEVQYVLVEKK